MFLNTLFSAAANNTIQTHFPILTREIRKDKWKNHIFLKKLFRSHHGLPGNAREFSFPGKNPEFRTCFPLKLCYNNEETSFQSKKTAARMGKGNFSCIKIPI